MRYAMKLVYVLVSIPIAIGIGLIWDWWYEKTHFTSNDDERLEAPKDGPRRK